MRGRGRGKIRGGWVDGGADVDVEVLGLGLMLRSHSRSRRQTSAAEVETPGVTTAAVSPPMGLRPSR